MFGQQLPAIPAGLTNNSRRKYHFAAVRPRSDHITIYMAPTEQVKRTKLSLRLLIKHYVMKTYGGVEV
jgi:hypothetical protein